MKIRVRRNYPPLDKEAAMLTTCKTTLDHRYGEFSLGIHDYSGPYVEVVGVHSLLRQDRELGYRELTRLISAGKITRR